MAILDGTVCIFCASNLRPRCLLILLRIFYPATDGELGLKSLCNISNAFPAFESSSRSTPAGTYVIFAKSSNCGLLSGILMVDGCGDDYFCFALVRVSFNLCLSFVVMLNLLYRKGRNFGQKKVKLPLLGEMSVISLAVVVFVFVFAVLWAINKKASYSWVGQDILGFLSSWVWLEVS
ncbi:hypothetical protein ACSBR1_012946 [Camellia fascicularis]